MDNVQDIRAFYDKSSFEEDERLVRHQLEWDTTWRYLEAYLPTEGRLLEVGAATGGYTRELARRGYHVTAVDLSPVLTDWSRARCAEEGLEERVRHVVSDARDLRHLTGEGFDGALVMGPLYHLVCEEDRRIVLRQVAALLPAGAVLVSAHICRLGILGELLRRVPGWVLTREPDSVLMRGRDPEDSPRGVFRGYFCRPEELASLHGSQGFETLVVAASEPGISADDEAYNRLEGDLRSAWLDLLFRVSAEPSTLGASRHLLYIGRKRGD